MARSTDHPCMVDGCSLTGRNQIGIRCRIAHDSATPFPTKGRTDAIFSIEGDAYLCDAHALGGGTIALMFEPDRSGDITVDVLSNRTPDPRSKHIKQPDEVKSV
jgi:hypothetical protein